MLKRSNLLNVFLLIPLIIIMHFLLAGQCYGAKLYTILPGADQSDLQLIRNAADFLGVDIEAVEKIDISTKQNITAPATYIISAEYAKSLKANIAKTVLKKIEDNRIKLLIVFNKSGLYNLFNFSQKIAVYSKERSNGVLSFSNTRNDILGELSDTKIQSKISGESYYIKASPANKESLITPLAWVDELGSANLTLATHKVGKSSVFLLSVNHFEENNNYSSSLISTLPYLVFIKDSFQEKCWHKVTNQANLTIDDPWLTEPYGNLAYAGLLKEMQKANFHTTIAFIPWNYDRNDADVVNLFLKNPDRYSIAIHGNNHDHYEFNEELPLYAQEANIRQAIVRMDEFQRLTRINYDRVMIFPHGISPKSTISILKRYNFLATTNSSVIPLGNSSQSEDKFPLSQAQLKYYSFPLLLRYDADVNRSVINVGLFLGKPMIIYTHQDYFFNGIDAFNKTAKYINKKSNNKIEWVNLKKIVQGLYMLKLRDDGAYDVKMSSNIASIKNHTGHKQTYYINEFMTEPKEISSLIIGDKVYTDKINSVLGKPITLLPGQSIYIEIIRRDTPNLKETSIKKNYNRFWVLRMLSDFRDIYLSRYKTSKKIVDMLKSYK